MQSIPADARLTLFLWPEGMFPKQIVYYLFQKGLVTSATQLYEGKTTDPRLTINITAFESGGFQARNPDDPKPAGKSFPCLRIDNLPGASQTRWVHETSAIKPFLEALYPEQLALLSTNVLDVATTNDILGALQQATADGVYYLKNAAGVTTFWSGLRDEDRSLPVAKLAKQCMVRILLKVQGWADSGLGSHGWLTPGLDRPGVVDVALAAWARYSELSYALDLFEDDKLTGLRAWYSRFKELPWWEELEERGRHPKELTYASDCREV